MNEIVAFNVCKQLKRLGKKYGTLVPILKEPKMTVLRMLSGAQEISIPDLERIASFCKVPVDEFFVVPQSYSKINGRRVFMGRISSDCSRRDLENLDKLTNLYLFHMKYQDDEFKSCINKNWYE